MNGLVLALTVGLAGLTQASALSVEPQGRLSPQVEASKRGAAPDRRPGPFQKLFVPAPTPAVVGTAVVKVPHGTSKTQESRVVCGMVVIPTDPTLDPRMVIRPKEPASAMIRRIPATACVD